MINEYSNDSIFSDFSNWKREIQSKTFSSFIRDTQKKFKNGDVVEYFHCHRSYKFRMHRQKKHAPNKNTKQKTQKRTNQDLPVRQV